MAIPKIPRQLKGISKGIKKADQGAKMERALAAALREALKPENMLRYGKLAAEMIRKRTRLGYGAKKSGSEKSKLKELKPGTKDSRKKLSQRGELSEFTSPNKSNLTRTGQLLNSVDGINPKTGSVTVGPTGSRSDIDKDNIDIGRYVTDAGRAFNNLSSVEIKRLNDRITKDVKQEIRRQLTKTK